MTSCGSMCASVGKPGRDVGNAIFWTALDAEVSDQTPSDCGIFQSALNVASVLPDANGVGDVSMPFPVVTWRGVPPDTGTAQICRRSISPAFVQ